MPWARPGVGHCDIDVFSIIIVCVCVCVCCVVPDTGAALAVGPIKPIIGQARSESGLVCILY